MADASPTVSVTESKYQRLRDTLESLFELDKADLDFGIYRLMATRNAEVGAFLDRQLKEVVRKELGNEAGAERAGLQAKLEAEQARRIKEGDDPETGATVLKLKKQLEDSGTLEDLEGRVYGHLTAFFGRYYDGGDFISQRRYGKDAYAIPYDGEEVVLHWANKDQYYIKSGETHRNYQFRVAVGKSEQAVRFTVVDAVAPRDNNKEADAGKRQYVLADDAVSVEGDRLTVRFEHRSPTAEEAEAAASGVVRVFGGDFAKPKKKGLPEPKTKGNAREQFAALAETRVAEALEAGGHDDWLKALSVVRDSGKNRTATEKKPQRTVLGQHLDRYTARAAYDYFIHKDLRGFLTRELDFYLKNEVLELDDIATQSPDHLARVQGRLRATRAVATAVIDFVSGIEEFQKKLWLKKKLVMGTRWLVSMRLVTDEKLLKRVAACAAVWDAWEALGFKPADAAEAKGWGSAAYLNDHDGLVLDSGVIEAADPGWTAAFLATVDDVDAATTGTLLHGENFNALNLLQERYRGEVKCVAVDPPYNTGGDHFPYKENYRHSSWLSAISSSVERAALLMRKDASFFLTIDDNERHRLVHVLDAAFGSSSRLPMVAWKKRSSPDARSTIGSVTDWIFCYVKNSDAPKDAIGKIPLSDDRIAAYTNPDSDPRGNWASVDMTGMTGRATKDQYYDVELPNGEIIGPPPGRSWGFAKATFDRLRKDNRIWFGTSGGNVPRQKKFVSESDGQAISTFWDLAEVGSNDEAQSQLSDLLGEVTFDSPKPPKLFQRFVGVSTDRRREGYILDYFAGSGTTAHAVINLNREDGGTRKFILVEMGEYFETVLVPRVMKVMYSPEWKDGKATEHDKPQPGLVKVFAIESYDDALENLPDRDAPLLTADQKDEPLLRYLLDIEHGPHLADTAAFANPWDATLRARAPGGDGTAERKVDLVETFNYLLGLRVHRHGAVRRYAGEFERSKHDEGDGKLLVKGKLKRDDDGAFAFQRIEGELADGTRVLVVWRGVTGDAEQDAAALEAHLADEAKREQDPDTRPFARVYVNGSCTLAQPAGGERRQFYLTEEAFKNAMFAVSEREASDRG